MRSRSLIGKENYQAQVGFLSKCVLPSVVYCYGRIFSGKDVISMSPVKILHRPSSAMKHSSCTRILSKLTCKVPSLINVSTNSISHVLTNISVE